MMFMPFILKTTMYIKIEIAYAKETVWSQMLIDTYDSSMPRILTSSSWPQLKSICCQKDTFIYKNLIHAQ